ncbi:AAA family ATPase [Pseudobutyrivibrio ruminis]|uniref:AAA family ATPase n=1 Tax=Pseudobutyrivibrio ruminis TaxID=46206 RepID=UPI00041FED41|nr:AAA family ATPase [Pseudobutyrivibrio ruminis]
MQYEKKIDKIIEFITDTLPKNKNIIIIGENFSGKTDLFIHLINNFSSNVYFIDTPNRYIEVKEISLEPDNIQVDIIDILQNRKHTKNINAIDTFGSYTGNIGRQFLNYRQDLELLFKDVTGKTLSIQQRNIDNINEEIVLVIDGLEINDIVRLSNGLQAIMRILLELLILKNNTNEEIIVLIDEIDLHLSAEICINFLNYLVEKFDSFKFIITTHSKDIVVGTNNAMIVAISEDNYYTYDADDIDNLGKAENIWKKVAMQGNEDDTEGDLNLLKLLYNHMMSNCFSDDDIEAFCNLDIAKMTRLEVFIYGEIEKGLSPSKNR